MNAPKNKQELIDESIQDWLHNEDASLNDCLDANIEVMFLSGQHIPKFSTKEVNDLEDKYSQELI